MNYDINSWSYCGCIYYVDWLVIYLFGFFWNGNSFVSWDVGRGFFW